MDKIQGYEIIQEVIFENAHGFVLGYSKSAQYPYAVWQFTETYGGQRDYYNGKYEIDRLEANRQFARRRENYQYLALVDIRLGSRIPKPYYRYYSTQRPVDIGTYTNQSGNRPVMIVNYDVDVRRPVSGGIFYAWGELTYANPLTKEQVKAYELKPSPCNQDEVSRRLLNQFAKGA